MTQLNEIKHDAGSYLICTALDSSGYEKWEPYVNVYVRARSLELWQDGEIKRSYSIAEHLEENGWIPPEKESLAEYLCLAPSGPLFHRQQCLERKGHEGFHRNGSFSWEGQGPW